MDEFYLTPEDYRIAELNGIDSKNLHQRFAILGWSKKKATTQPLHQKKYDRKILLIANSNGISDALFRIRVREYGWNIHDASTIPPRKIDNFMKIAVSNGIDKNTYYARVYAGWSKEDASTIPADSRFRKIKK